MIIWIFCEMAQVKNIMTFVIDFLPVCYDLSIVTSYNILQRTIYYGNIPNLGVPRSLMEEVDSG